MNQTYFLALPMIRKTEVAHFGHLPFIAIIPFFIVTCLPSFISTCILHFMHLPSTIVCTPSLVLCPCEHSLLNSLFGDLNSFALGTLIFYMENI